MAEDNQHGNPNRGAETPNDAYKQLQRRLEQARKREKVYQEQAAQQQRVDAKIDALIESNQAMMNMLVSNGLASDGEAQSAHNALDQSKQSNNSDGALNDIMRELHEAETMWDDERLSDARQAWSIGNYAEAAKMVATTLSGEQSDDDLIDAEVERRVQRNGARNVDINESTAPSDSAALQNEDTLGGALAGRNGRDFWKANKDKILDNVRTGRLSTLPN